MGAPLKVEPDSEVTLTFNGGPRLVEGKFGPQHAYEWLKDGQDYTIYATKGLHFELDKLKLTTGDVVKIARTGSGTDTRYACTVESHTDPTVVAPVVFSALANLKEACLKDAKDTFARLEIEARPVDLQKYADTLFISASKIQSIVQQFTPKDAPPPGAEEDELSF